MSNSWSREELEATVSDYIEMMMCQMTGQSYNKTAHRRRLQKNLNGRTEAAIELKHQNISAVLRDMHYFWIPGYKPRGNYQGLLYQVVEEQIESNPAFDDAALNAVRMPAVAPSLANFERFIVEPPKPTFRAEEQSVDYKVAKRPRVSKVDYIEREARNSSLGLAGEKLIVAYEQWRLSVAGKEHLAGKVEHVSVTKGDGYGFDILSFEQSGKERFIEVKTTSFAKETPFFVTRNELGFSKQEAESYFLYRLFEFRSDPRLFRVKGAMQDHCNLVPLIYQATF
jgi:hypothetical protein